MKTESYNKNCRFNGKLGTYEESIFTEQVFFSNALFTVS